MSWLDRYREQERDWRKHAEILAGLGHDDKAQSALQNARAYARLVEQEEQRLDHQNCCGPSYGHSSESE